MSLTDSTTRNVQIVTGSSTATFTAPNLITYQLPGMGFVTGRDEVAMKSLTVYYSWPNVSQALANNTYSYIWPATGLTYPIVMSDGIYQFADLLSYLQQVMVQNGHYLVDSNGLNVFFLNIVVNPVLYCLSLIVTPLPPSLPTNWTNPGAVNLSAAGGNGPQLVIPTTIATLLGFAAGSYPAAPQTTTFSLNSGIPQITGVTSINLLCNLVDNRGFSLSPNILTTVPLPSSTMAGSLLSTSQNNLDWTPIKQQQTFQTITIEFVDQLLRPLQIRDPTGIVIVLNMRKRAQ